MLVLKVFLIVFVFDWVVVIILIFVMYVGEVGCEVMWVFSDFFVGEEVFVCCKVCFELFFLYGEILVVLWG